MFKSLLALSTALVLIVPLLYAQDSTAAPGTARAGRTAQTPAPERSTGSSARRVARAAPRATPTATPAPRKRGFFERLFGRRPKATPSPAVQATPTPAQRRKRPRSAATPAAAEQERSAAAGERPGRTKKKQPSEGSEQKDEASVSPPASESEPAAKPAETQPPAPDPAAATTAATPAPKKTSKSKQSAGEKKSATPPPDVTDPEAAEKWKYDQAKATALEDAEVQELKQKADAAGNEEEVRKALRAYNKALFQKMRRIDPTLKDRIDRMETGVLKRLGDQP